ncbi:PREDICTED: E3 ubiquitin-protein ligase RNF180-like, partial [Mesitornis unicolor]|uniref:E3 ubiquitin-protein ligase RNF180-like n=1 Tax=Mesitornis unicolor TaxID=54374 RepID=UPI0005292F15
MSNEEADTLCCWSCRKYIANSVCLAKCHGKEVSIISQPLDAAQQSCNICHVNLDTIPEWVKCVIEKAQWTIGKLHCPFCEACLGGFNFVCNTKCSCGQLVNIHFCKSRTDYQPAFSVNLAKSSGKHLPLLKIQSGFSKDTWHEVVTATLEIRNQGLSYMARNNNGTERLTEALCLEVRAPRFEMKSKKLPKKALNKKKNHSALYPVNDTYSVRPFHRRSRSLDLNIREKLVLSPTLYETCSMGTIYCGQNDYTRSGLQLESSGRDDSAFQDQYSSSTDQLQKRFCITSFTKLVHGETESECDFKAIGQSCGNAAAAGSPLMLNLSTSAVEEEQYLTPVGPVQPTSISFTQKLNKRERNKLKSLRRKQRRQEQWLQKQ